MFKFFRMNKKEKKIFFTSFLSTMLIFVLVFGLIEVDYNSRRIGFGDEKTLIYEMTGKTWDETCNDVKLWYNNLVSTLTEFGGGIKK